ncbi:MAG TPA: HD domain-containing phosphohydrolase [Burkholderiales bacterium]|jgi:putative two-component system response regulator
MSAGGKPVILCVDDASDLLALMGKALGEDYRVITADNGRDALAKAHGEPRPDLVLLDIDMPRMSGLEACRALKANAQTASIPVVFLTARNALQQQVEGLEAGAVDYITKPFNAFVLRARVRIHAALANRRYALERLVQERTAQLERTRTELIRRLSRAMELHESAAVGNRVMRLSHYARLVAQAAGARPEMAEMLFQAAPLHDIGKLGVPAEILRKREKLSAPDWERVKRHPQLGADIIGEHDDPLLRLARILALAHHEHWDGSGYPQGLKGEAIPWAGRLMAIVDTFESMTTTQFYRDALPLERAEGEIMRGAGTRYDPKLVESFQKALPVMKKVREKYADQLGDLINLDFSPKVSSAAVKPKAGTKEVSSAKRR